MSVTATVNPITYNTLSVLADYELHHSPSQYDPSLNSHPLPLEVQQQPQQNPADWPVDYRRVPAYRPVNTRLDQSHWRVYLSKLERGFIAIMFLGVRTNIVYSRCQEEKLGGRIHDRIFRYKIGGDF
ncbi:hypothetical protein K490DRAFT_70289 [Saccharata proteae CBS 121410]|uniref:Uncharacterized protein n=1 Tax=Saccharata proteae CBS 121410 TaxID=1314787 RepID=A0A9P4I3F7_9PEZI|nr:hypothetical protein K490DRAFT_70289 [Saccharata proteae CBS 121410]